METGIYYDNQHCLFRVWAPEKERVLLKILHPFIGEFQMARVEGGYHQLAFDDIPDGTRYMFSVDDEKFLPDPASHFQPDGVHAASAIVDHESFDWQDQFWKGICFDELVFYELHVGTFTNEGTFEAIIPLLDSLVDLGVNAIELMPVSQFSGSRNWGYDGVYPYAVQNSYGGPGGLKKLVNACHQKGIAVFLDVVYNHLGPEGNYLQEYGPYFSNKYCTPWGEAINFDGKWSDGVSAFVVDNMQHWFEHYHIDGLRCDAIHEIYDASAVHLWEKANSRLKTLMEKHGRLIHLVAESDSNNPKVVMPVELGGVGFRAQWLDDFQHALYVLIDPDGASRYSDFGSIAQLAIAFRDGFVHSGEFVNFRKKRHGASSAAISPDRFVVFNENHDQTGNRVQGKRMASFLDPQRLKLAAAVCLLSPYVPMLFMGEEYGETAPFHYFVDHSDPTLLEAIRNGRKAEFASLNGNEEPADPKSLQTFLQSKLNWKLRQSEQGSDLLAWHRRLIALRKSLPALQSKNRQNLQTNILSDDVLEVIRVSDDGKQTITCVFNISATENEYPVGKKFNSFDIVLSSNGNFDGKQGQRVSSDELLHLTPWSVSVLC